MIVSDHTTKVFDADLIKLTQKVAEMGGFAQKQIADAMEALARRDLLLAHQVVAADAVVDDMQRQIEEKAVETIALRQPMAIDLRAIVAMLRIANDLERIGDLAKNIGKRAIAMGNQPSATHLDARPAPHDDACGRPIGLGARQLRRPQPGQGA